MTTSFGLRSPSFLISQIVYLTLMDSQAPPRARPCNHWTAAYEELYKVGISFHSGPKAPSVFEGVTKGYHRWMTSTMSNLFRGTF